MSDGYYLEGCDRCNTILIMIEELLVGHPAVERVHGVADKIQQASDLVMDAYQDIAKYEDEQEADHD